MNSSTDFATPWLRPRFRHPAALAGLAGLFLLFLLSLTARAQAPDIVWQNALGGSENDVAKAITRTPDGGFAVAGQTNSSNGDVSSKNGFSDAWVVKLDASGNLVWQKTVGGPNLDDARAITATSDGGFVVAGVMPSDGSSDAWVVKLDASGNTVWQKTYGGTSSDVANAITATSDGGFVVVGTTASNDGDVSGNNGSFDYWILKLNASGELLWQKTLGGSDADFGEAITLAGDGGYVVAGYSSSNDGDVSGNNGERDAWVVKLDASGNLVWQKSLGGSNQDFATAITMTSDMGFVVSGPTASSDGDVTGNKGSRDFWVVKLDASGNLVWQKTLGSTGFDVSNAVVTTSDGGIVVAGGVPTNDGDVTENKGGYDIWVVKLNASGNLVWQKSYGGTLVDEASALTTTSDGGLVVAGSTESNDGDASGNQGARDFWVVRLASPTPPTPNNGIRYVDASRPDDSGDGLSWATAHKSLQTALSAAVSGDKIWVASGTYKPTTSTSDRRAVFALKDDLAIYGGFTSGQANLSDRNPDPVTNGTVLSGDIDGNGNLSGNSYHIIKNGGLQQERIAAGGPEPSELTASAILDGFKITGGNADHNFRDNSPDARLGGGMFLGSGSPTITNCLFQDNSADNSGGAVFNAGSPKFTKCTFVGNRTDFGGGGAFYSEGQGAPTEFTKCTFRNNIASSSGGAINCILNSTKITDCVFENNSVSDERSGNGGAINSNGGDLQIVRTTFTSNNAREGGAVWHSTPQARLSAELGTQAGLFGDLTLTNCSFLNNTAYQGGAMYNFSTIPVFLNCSFIGNSASDDGGVLYENSGSTRMTNCSFQGNSATVSGGVAYLVNNASPVFTNDVFWNNTENNTIQGGGSSPGTATITYSLIDQAQVPPGEGNKITSTNPFVSTTSNVLRDGSPAIDMGLNSANDTGTDLAGNARVFNGTIDMGAYESQTTVTPPVEAPTVSNLSASPNPICAGQPVTFMATVGNTSGTYDYTLTNNNGTTKTGQASGGNFSQSVTAMGSGAQNFTLTITTSAGNGMGSTSLTVNAAPAPPMLSADPATITAGQSSNLTAAGCSGTVTWSNGLGTGTTKSVSPATTTTYTATCTTNGCTSTNGSVTVTVQGTPPPPPPATGECLALGDQCTGNEFEVKKYNFEMAAAGFRTLALTYRSAESPATLRLTINGALRTMMLPQTPADRSFATLTLGGTYPFNAGSNAIAIASGDGYFCLRQLCTDGATGGCTPPAAPMLSADPASITAGQSSSLTASGCSGTVTWSNGLGTGNTKSVSPATTTTYIATCTTNGCTSGDGSVMVTVQGTPPPTTGNCLALGDQCSGNQFEVKNYTLSQATAGNRTLALTYRAPEGPATLRLTINGTLRTMTLPQTSGSGAYATVTLGGTYALNAGGNAISIASGGGYFCFRQLCTNGDGTPPPPQPAPSNCLALGDQCSGNMFEIKNYTLGQATAGSRTLALTYRAPEGPATLRLTINGTLRTMTLPQTSGSGAYATVTLGGTYALNAGGNAISIASGGGYFCFRQLCTDGGNSATRLSAEEITTAPTPLAAYPNPTEGTFEASFYLAPGQRASLDVNDMLGRPIWTKALTGRGEHKEQVRLPEAASGMFILRLQRENAQPGQAAEFTKVLMVK